MYIRGTPPSNVDLQGLVEWLLLEFEALEVAFEEQRLELERVKEQQNAV